MQGLQTKTDGSFDRLPDCYAAADAPGALPIHVADPASLPALLASLPPVQAAFLAACRFEARPGEVALLPGLAEAPGLAGAVFGMGEAAGPHDWGALPAALPAGTCWRLPPGLPRPQDAVLGWALGAYRFDRFRREPRPAAPRLVPPSNPARSDAIDEALCIARATWLARDLINMPANLLGPAELVRAAQHALHARGAAVELVEGAALCRTFPVIEAVGRGAARPPLVLRATWRHPDAPPDAPLVSLCGKGVCFDTGGYDLKPSAGMLRMKKDMGGAAVALGLACLVMERALPVRLEVRLGCVENMVSGSAMRPLDIVTTRRGRTIEIGNTDAEGRLVLCELLEEAAEAQPSVLLDFATLTGAARVALGPDLPALFSNDDVVASCIEAGGRAAHDPVWRLPLWQDYDSWLDGGAAELANVADKPHAGAIVAGLFLERFVPRCVRWAHLDVYCWNDSTRPGRPAGGEAHGMRAAFTALKRIVSRAPAQQ